MVRAQAGSGKARTVFTDLPWSHCVTLAGQSHLCALVNYVCKRWMGCVGVERGGSMSAYGESSTPMEVPGISMSPHRESWD